MSWYPAELLPFRCDHEGFPSPTSDAQAATEDECAAWYAESAATGLVLARDRHVAYLLRSLDGLSGAFTSLDASRTWILYWILHSLDLLDARPTAHFPAVVDFLRRCQCPGGGFGGGPQQGPHTASTFAAVLALLIVGTEEAYAAIDRAGLLAFYRAVKHPGAGGFRVQPDGEMDVRGAYTVLAVARLLGLDAADPGLLEGTPGFLAGCQSHEGGFGGEPGNEAHGGYTYCAVAGLALAGALPLCDVRALTRWLAGRQMALEGGFQGRANKLVDSCYSFWQGAVFALLPPPLAVGVAPSSPVAGAAPTGTGAPLEGHPAEQQRQQPQQPPGEGREVDSEGGGDDDMLLDRRRLQTYVLACCQSPDGGMRDKPGKARDLYHTCYALSGLAVAQHGRHDGAAPVLVLGGPANAVAATHPAFNLRHERVAAARAYFAAHPL